MITVINHSKKKIQELFLTSTKNNFKWIMIEVMSKYLLIYSILYLIIDMYIFKHTMSCVVGFLLATRIRLAF